MKNLIAKKHVRICVVSLAAVVSVTCLTIFCVIVFTNLSRARLAERVAEEVLRFHVIANSDSEEDQNLKLQVRDALISYMAGYSDSFTDADEAARFAAAHVSEMNELAASVIAALGYDYQVTTSVTRCAFPDKTYGDLTFPAGTYEALRVEIGAARGQNWWCVLYPPLCFTEEGGTVPGSSKEKLKEVLSEEDYARLEDAAPGGRVKIRFRLLEWLFGE